jgi:hypothetical protein
MPGRLGQLERVGASRDLLTPQLRNLCEQGDCGLVREGLSRRIAYHKCVSLVRGTNIVQRELDLLEVHIRVADPKLYFANVGGGG